MHCSIHYRLCLSKRTEKSVSLLIRHSLPSLTKTFLASSTSSTLLIYIQLGMNFEFWTPNARLTKFYALYRVRCASISVSVVISKIPVLKTVPWANAMLIMPTFQIRVRHSRPYQDEPRGVHAFKFDVGMQCDSQLLILLLLFLANQVVAYKIVRRLPSLANDCLQAPVARIN
jgi:hypothetical protein